MNPRSWTKLLGKMKKIFKKEEKEEAVRLYEKGMGCQTISRIIKANPGTILRWVNLYNKFGEIKDYGHYHPVSAKEKVRLVSMYKRENVSLEQFALKHDIPRSSFSKWVLQTRVSLQQKSRNHGKEKDRKDSRTKADREAAGTDSKITGRSGFAKKIASLSKCKNATKQEIVIAIDSLRHKYPLTMLLDIKKMARSTFYYQLNRINKDKYSDLKKIIAEISRKNKSYGYRRIVCQLKNERNITVNHKLVLKLMNEMQIKVSKPRRHYHSYKGTVGSIADNLIARNFKTGSPDSKWTTDISQININGDKLYLSVILDMFNSEVVTYKISSHPDLKLVLSMLDSAIKNHKCSGKLILHSDQGWHYQHPMYCRKLKEHQIIQSMSRKGNCYDNAIMESFFGVMKNELLYVKDFESKDEFIKAFKDYVDYYNNDRIKLRLETSPVNYRMSFINNKNEFFNINV
jgi:transposase InsO family protein/transposase-like protein